MERLRKESPERARKKRKAPKERLKLGKLKERLYCRENTRKAMAVRKGVSHGMMRD
jgi:hypothetical protein